MAGRQLLLEPDQHQAGGQYHGAQPLSSEKVLAQPQVAEHHCDQQFGQTKEGHLRSHQPLDAKEEGEPREDCHKRKPENRPPSSICV